MQHATQIEIIQRVLDHQERRTTDMDPAVVDSPVARYLDPARLVRERQVLFRTTPLVVAHSSELAAPGAFITRDIAGVPALVARDSDGHLRGFINVCRHRGTQLVSERCGKRNTFACPYHAWTYRNDGRLQSIRHEAGFAGVDKADRGLVPVGIEEAFGFVWLRLDGESPAVGQALPPALAEDLQAFDLATHAVYRPRTIRKAIGWKLSLDIFLEGYHVNYAHRRTIAPMFIDNVNLFDRFEPHMRAVLPKRSVADLRGTAAASWRLRPHANILYVLFPNTLLLVQPDHVGVFHIYPETVSTSRVEAYTLVPEPPASYKARRYWDQNLDILYTALDEDFALGESIQRGLGSGANETMLFGRYEQSLAWFHDSVDARTMR